MRFLVREWTPEGFRQRLEEEVGTPLERWEPAVLVEDTFRGHVGPACQDGEALHFLSFHTLAGRLSPEDLFVAATTAERFGSGRLFLTPLQDIIVPDVAEGRLDEAMDHLRLAPTCEVQASQARRGTVSCTGAEYCELALAETKSVAALVVQAIERAGLSFPVPLKIAISGCPNDCGHAQIADIGLIGAQPRGADRTGDVFDLVLGARLGAGAQAGRLFRAKVEAADVPQEVVALITAFSRNSHQPFRSFAEHVVDGGEYQI